MKVLTLKQPWATLISEGIKVYEFRSWKTNYRGKILIHAGCGIEKEELKRFDSLKLDYPSKKIIAIAEIEDCLELNDELNNIPLYITYSENLEKVNQMISYVNDELTDYFYEVLNIYE